MVVRFNTDDVVIHLAAAGAGKSTAAMQEIQELLQVYRPDEIAFLSYTKKGVETGITKALQVNKDLTPDDLYNFKTLHALSFRESKLTRVNIMASEDIMRFNKAFNFNLSPCPDSFGHSTEDDKLLQRYDSERAGAIKGVFVNGSYDVMRYNRLINAYKSFKESHGLVDFYDCLERYMEVGEPLKGVKVFLIDESQDTTPLQWEVIMKMSAEAEKIRCYGDDYQTIFSHAGADPSILVELAAHYKCVKHETSFRIPKEVYNFSKGITDIITEKVDKDYKPRADAPEGFVKFGTDRAILARKIRDDLKNNGPVGARWYLLFRTNCFIDDMAETLQQFIVPYSDQRGFCIDKRSLSKIKRYYQYRLNGYGSAESREKFMKEYNIKDFNDDFMESDLIPGKEKYFFQDLVNEYGLDTLEKLSSLSQPFCLLSTIHKVKGGEADYTALFMDCTKLVNDNIMFDSDSELRVLYVGVTRCREGLYIVPAKGKYSMQKLLDIVVDLQK